MERRVAEVVVTSAFLVVGMYFLTASMQMGLGALTEPGAGMLPAFGAAMLIVLGTIQLVLSASGRVTGEGIEFSRESAFKIATALVTLIAAALLIPRIGFLPVSVAMLFVLFFVVASLPIVRAILMSGLVAGANYVVFAILLKVPLP